MISENCKRELIEEFHKKRNDLIEMSERHDRMLKELRESNEDLRIRRLDMAKHRRILEEAKIEIDREEAIS